jgi:hypothetical protein
MQTILDAMAVSLATTPLRAAVRQKLVNDVVVRLDEAQAERFMDMAYERGEFAPSE